MGTKAKAALADGFAIDLGVFVRPKLRFPALAYGRRLSGVFTPSWRPPGI